MNLHGMCCRNAEFRADAWHMPGYPVGSKPVGYAPGWLKHVLISGLDAHIYDLPGNLNENSELLPKRTRFSKLGDGITLKGGPPPQLMKPDPKLKP